MLYLAAATLTVVLVASGVMVVLGPRVRQLSTISPAPERTRWPLVSVIAPARNEEKNIEAAVRSLLQIDYQPLQLTMINDRSTDATGAILDRLAAEFPQLNVVHLTELPAGWLGKNHALQLGADRSRGEWLLFTDADIVFEPTTLRRAIEYVEQEELDMLAAFPEARMPGWLLRAFVMTFSLMFIIFTRPWSVRNPRSSAHCGVGAFNLVRASAYHRADGHRPLAMRPDDDLKLGKSIKAHGGRCDVVEGFQLLHVEWYGSVRELIVGLEKNSFAALEYNIPAVVLSTMTLLLVGVWPFVAVFVTQGVTAAMYAGAAGLQLLLAWRAARHIGSSHFLALAYPLTILLFVYIQWRSLLLTLRQGGIRWRDTFYSLAELKANRV
ncbi:MAG: glycosyltransferase family 2 protein [Pirellulales bacterium]